MHNIRVQIVISSYYLLAKLFVSRLPSPSTSPPTLDEEEAKEEEEEEEEREGSVCTIRGSSVKSGSYGPQDSGTVSAPDSKV